MYTIRVIFQKSWRHSIVYVCLLYQKLYAAHISVSFPLPPSEVWAGYERKGKPSIGTESLMHPSPVRCTLQSAGRSLKKICTVSQGYRSARQDPVQNMYAVYKMRVISQNSRRKAIAEDVPFLGPSSCKFFASYAPIWPLFPFFKMAFQVYTYSC